jgi:hypothetical protein
MYWRLTSLSRRSLWMGVAASSLLHLLLIVALVVDAAWPFLHLAMAARRRPDFAISLEARLLEQATGDPVVVIEVERTWRDVAAADAAIAPRTDGKLEQRVVQRIHVAAERADRRSDEENHKQLEQLSGQLERLSSQDSVDAMAKTLGKWLGTSERATQPATEPLAGEFNYDTAQLHDVLRRRNTQDQWQYWALLVDGAGRMRESSMEPEEGASAYKTMQLIKSSPLAEMIYRRVAMSLLDKIIQAAKQAEQAASGEVEPAPLSTEPTQSTAP